MSYNPTLYDNAWLTRALESAPIDSWAREVMNTLSSEGGIYIDKIRLWFHQFPLKSTKHRRTLKTRLESFADSDHIGAVNEISWFEFMCAIGLESHPLPPARMPAPDFKVVAPIEFFVEVSTLNTSAADKKKHSAGQCVDLNHPETLRRLLLKVATEKKLQVEYAARESRPSLLVVYDYSLWSSFPTRILGFLASKFDTGASPLPTELSAIVYVKRVGISINLSQSAIFHNPAARYPLPINALPPLSHFSHSVY